MKFRTPFSELNGELGGKIDSFVVGVSIPEVTGGDGIASRRGLLARGAIDFEGECMEIRVCADYKARGVARRGTNLDAAW